MTHAERMARLREADLYVVTGEEFSAGRSTLEVLDAVLDAGVRLVQLREKGLSKGALCRLGEACLKKTAAAGALLIVNDHLDVALAIGADGVHLGRDDLPVDKARALAPDLILGASSHSLEQALESRALGASYVNIGPIFPTTTKATHTRFLGPPVITQFASSLDIPFTCMGGINEGNLDSVLEAGAKIVAVVTAVTAQPDMTSAARRLRDRIISGRRG